MNLTRQREKYNQKKIQGVGLMKKKYEERKCKICRGTRAWQITSAHKRANLFKIITQDQYYWCGK